MNFKYSILLSLAIIITNAPRLQAENQAHPYAHYDAQYLPAQVDIFSLSKALQEAEQYINKENGGLGRWMPRNKSQEALLKTYSAVVQDLARNPFKPEELKTKVSRFHTELNQFLRENGFNITLAPIRDGFGVVAILNILVEWAKEGQVTTLISKTGFEHAAVKMTNQFGVYSSPDHQHPIVSLETKSGDIVYMTIADKKNANDIAPLHKNLQQQEGKFILTFPMVNLDMSYDLDWLLGMVFRPYFISQAKQQIKLKMNEKGARAQAATAIAMEKLAVRSPQVDLIVINDDFLFWIERPGCSEPIFKQLVSEKYWGNPGSLSL